jgi:tRNA (guanine37-N1)-methyltransferase
VTFHATVLTLYPEMFPGPLGFAIAGRALAEGRWSLDAVNIRDFATDRHRTVDDTPAGGGAGMVLRVDILAAAVDAQGQGRPVLAMTPRGKPLTQARIRELAAGPGAVVLCGRFEGFDERLFEGRDIEEVSIGDGCAGAAGCLRSAASRRNGRRFKRGRGKPRKRPARISALYPTC